MLRKVTQLVRHVYRTDLMQAILEMTSMESIDSAKPADLWSLMMQNKVSLELLDETDAGIEVFPTDYDAKRHSALAVVNLLSPKSYQPSEQSIQPSEEPVRVPSKGRPNTVRRVATLTRNIDYYEVMRAVVEVLDAETFEALTASEDLWWICLRAGVRVEADEHSECEIVIEHEPYKPVKHKRLPIVILQETMVSEEVLPPMDFLMNWHPSVVANEKDKQESERVGKIVMAEPNQCYWNARTAIRSLPDYSEAIYVEGFIVTQEGACFEHGWIIKDGKVIDPTLPDDDALYFGGLEFTGREQIRRFLLTKWGSKWNGCPFYRAFGWNPGLESPTFLQAFKRAIKYLSSAFGAEGVEAAKFMRTAEKLPWSDDWR